MKKIMLIIVIALVLTTLLITKKITGFHLRELGNPKSAPESSGSFESSVKSAKQFSDAFRRGLDSKKEGNYDDAIRHFNEALPHTSMGPEVAMVYEQLAEIYHNTRLTDKELYYLDQIPRYTMSDEVKREARTRASEIRTNSNAIKPN